MSSAGSTLSRTRFRGPVITLYRSRTTLRSPPVITLYRFAWVRSLRMLLRLKALQVGSIAAVALPATALLSSDQALGAGAYAGVVAITIGVAGLGGSMAWYCERFVQQLDWMPHSQSIRVSTLTMWGNRLDRDFPVAQVNPTWDVTGPSPQEEGQRVVPLHLSYTTFMIVNHSKSVKSRTLLNELLRGQLVAEAIVTALENGKDLGPT